jgi:hypothetical protein
MVRPATKCVERLRPLPRPLSGNQGSLCWPSDLSVALWDFYWRDVEVGAAVAPPDIDAEIPVRTVTSNGGEYGLRTPSFVSGRADPDHHSACADLGLTRQEQEHARQPTSRHIPVLPM